MLFTRSYNIFFLLFELLKTLTFSINTHFSKDLFFMLLLYTLPFNSGLIGFKGGGGDVYTDR